MNKVRSILLSVCMLALFFPSKALWAHPDHTILELDDAVSEAQFSLARLVYEKIIPETWNDAKHISDKNPVQIIHGKRRWVFVYENLQEKDLLKKRIKIYMTPLGKFISYEFMNN